jgi:hypothetical protein
MNSMHRFRHSREDDQFLREADGWNDLPEGIVPARRSDDPLPHRSRVLDFIVWSG